MTIKINIFHATLALLILLLSSCQSDQNSRTLLRIGNKQYNKGFYNDSESSYLKSLEKENSPEALYGRGNSSQRLLSTIPSSNLSETDSVSLSSYNAALEQSAGNNIKKSKIYHNMGNLCYQAGLRNQKMQHLEESNKKFSESVEYYKSSLRLNPSDDETRYNLCMALYMLENNKQNQENQNQDQSQNQDQQNEDKKQNQEDQNKDNQSNDQNKENQNKQDKSDGSDSNKQQDKDKEEKNQNKNKDNNQEKGNERGDDQKQQKDKNKENNSQNNQNQPKDQNKDKKSSSSTPENTHKVEGSIDKKTANQLLNAAQHDENKVQKKIEKAIGVGGSYEKDW